MPTKNLPGVDGWVSSDFHARCERATTAAEQASVYDAWAATYDDEMCANGLASYRSVTTTVLELLPGAATLQRARPLRILDVGCGTGLLGECLISHLPASCPQRRIELVGVDLSRRMLDGAARRRVYHRLVELDLNAIDWPFAAMEFPLLVSSGLFLPGHCGPEILPRLLALLSPGGVFVFTVRQRFYDEQRRAYVAAMQQANGRVQSALLMPYYGSISAYVLVVTRRDPARERLDPVKGEWM